MALLRVIDPDSVRRHSRAWRVDGECVGFVPTMGALHPGHLSLVRAAREAGATRVVVSIFVNPTQFGQGEDLAAYPRDLASDAEKLRAEGVDLLFLPEADVIYGPGAQTWVSLDHLPSRLCGLSRPAHFRGVSTVVTVLLNIVQPNLAVFGQKDYQQLQVIRRMVLDLHMPVRIVGAPIIREPDGLAMSSRNIYLSADERKRALCLRRALDGAQAAVDAGERSAAVLLKGMRRTCSDVGGDVDYVALVDPETLEDVSWIDGPIRALLAVQIGPARLIDNALIRPNA